MLYYPILHNMIHSPDPAPIPPRPLRGHPASVRSVFKISCLFLRPRPWQFEI